MSEENKALMHRVLGEVLNAGNMAVVDEVYAGDVFFHTSGAPDIRGTEGVKRIMTAHRTAFPDGHFAVEEMIAESDRVATRWTFEGTHKSEWRGVAPTGRKVVFRGTSTQRVSGGKIVEDSSVYDALDTMQQLGAVTDPVVTEANKALVRCYFEEGLNQGNLAVIDEIIGEAPVLRATPWPEIHDRPALKQMISLIRTAFPDGRFTIDDLVAEGDRVVVRWTSAGTQLGEFMGVPASAREAGCQGINIFRVADGKIVEQWENFDALGLYQKLGALPPLPAPLAQAAGQPASRSTDRSKEL